MSAEQVLPFTAQLFTQGISAKFEVTKELVCINSLCERTTNEHIFKEVETTLNQYNQTCNVLDCVTTYDGKICGAEKGKIYKDCENGYILDYSLII